jgi:oligosaccharide reducing-end xylanase
MHKSFQIVTLIIIIIYSAAILNGKSVQEEKSVQSGSFYTNKYENLFVSLLGINPNEVNEKINDVFNQLFYGDDTSQRIYYPVGSDMAYIKDVWNNDVRSEGMSFCMMIALQLNRQQEFNRLWKWAKTYMQYKNGPREGYFAWQCKADGSVIDSSSASDGEEWFATSLFLASKRWGDGEGIFNYKVEAQRILDAMLNKIPESDNENDVTNMFNKKKKMVVFVPNGVADKFTDPYYHFPHFYELWARWANKNNEFWAACAETSRGFWKLNIHPETGLASDYAKFDGIPYESKWGGNHDDFRYDAWRVAMNIAMDYVWFAKDPWQVEQSNRLLKFFYSKGIDTYKSLYTLDGKALPSDHSIGLVAMNAVAALAADMEQRKEFVEALWNAEIPVGRARYFDGTLYMLGILQVSGNFRIYKN